jgi:hypothetical protein
MVEGRTRDLQFLAEAGCTFSRRAWRVILIYEDTESGFRTLAVRDPIREHGERCGRTLISDRRASWRTGRRSGAARGGCGRIAGPGPNADHRPGLPHGGRS